MCVMVSVSVYVIYEYVIDKNNKVVLECSAYKCNLDFKGLVVGEKVAAVTLT